MATTFTEAFDDATKKYPQHAAYLHALLAASSLIDTDAPDCVEWSEGDDALTSTKEHHG